jgi:hypothetical protein
MVCNDRKSLNTEPDFSSIKAISRGRGNYLGDPFLSKFDGTSLLEAIVSSQMPT